MTELTNAKYFEILERIGMTQLQGMRLMFGSYVGYGLYTGKKAKK